MGRGAGPLGLAAATIAAFGLITYVWRQRRAEQGRQRRASRSGGMSAPPAAAAALGSRAVSDDAVDAGGVADTTTPGITTTSIDNQPQQQQEEQQQEDQQEQEREREQSVAAAPPAPQSNEAAAESIEGVAAAEEEPQQEEQQPQQEQQESDDSVQAAAVESAAPAATMDESESNSSDSSSNDSNDNGAAAAATEATFDGMGGIGFGASSGISWADEADAYFEAYDARPPPEGTAVDASRARQAESWTAYEAASEANAARSRVRFDGADAVVIVERAPSCVPHFVVDGKRAGGGDGDDSDSDDEDEAAAAAAVERSGGYCYWTGHADWLLAHMAVRERERAYAKEVALLEAQMFGALSGSGDSCGFGVSDCWADDAEAYLEAYDARPPPKGTAVDAARARRAEAYEALCEANAARSRVRFADVDAVVVVERAASQLTHFVSGAAGDSGQREDEDEDEDDEGSVSGSADGDEEEDGECEARSGPYRHWAGCADWYLASMAVRQRQREAEAKEAAAALLAAAVSEESSAAAEASPAPVGEPPLFFGSLQAGVPLEAASDDDSGSGSWSSSSDCSSAAITSATSESDDVDGSAALWARAHGAVLTFGSLDAFAFMQPPPPPPPRPPRPQQPAAVVGPHSGNHMATTTNATGSDGRRLNSRRRRYLRRHGGPTAADAAGPAAAAPGLQQPGFAAPASNSRWPAPGCLVAPAQQHWAAARPWPQQQQQQPWQYWH